MRWFFRGKTVGRVYFVRRRMFGNEKSFIRLVPFRFDRIV